MNRFHLLLAASIGTAALVAAPAQAQQNFGGGFSISGGVTATTDYRFRGISQTNGDPALQGSVTVDHVSGIYGGVFASTLSDDLRPGEIEIDGFIGYTREIASGTDIDVGVQLYGYPNNGSLTNASFFEPYASVRHTLGPVTAEVGAAYAPEQEALADNDSLYVYGDIRGGIPFSRFTLIGRVGYTSGPARFTAYSDYLDWRLGVQYVRGSATFAVEYVDTDLPSAPNADGAVLASLRIGF
jgi:uncharacterized protein (TIGR02001 family)